MPDDFTDDPTSQERGRDFTRTFGGSGPRTGPRYDPENFDSFVPESNKGYHAKLEIDGTRVPLVNDCVEVVVRKGDLSDLMRFTTARVPHKWINGTNWSEFIQSVRATEGVPTCDVYLRTPEAAENNTDDWVLVHRGYLGGSGGGTSDPEIRLTINDYAKFFDSPVSLSVTTDATVGDVFTRVTDQLAEKIPNVSEVPVIGDPSALDNAVVELVGGVTADSGPPFEYTDIRLRPKKFQANRHSIHDALEWAADIGGVFHWIEPTPDGGIGLYVTERPTSNQYVGGGFDEDGADVTVSENGVLTDVRPANQVTVRGSGRQSYASVGDFEFKNPLGGDGTFPVATATHEKLLERAGGEVIGISMHSEKGTEQAIRNEAKRLLKQKIDTAGAGAATLALAPFVRPYDGVAMHPIAPRTDEDVERLNYEVEEVRHEVSARSFPTTTLYCSVYTDTDDITVDVRHEQL